MRIWWKSIWISMYPILLIKQSFLSFDNILLLTIMCQRNISLIVKWVWKKNRLKNSNTHFQGFLSSPLPERLPLLTPSFNSNLHRVLPSLFIRKRKRSYILWTAARSHGRNLFMMFVQARDGSRVCTLRRGTIANLLARTLITLIITLLSKADRNTKEVYSTLNYVSIAPSHWSPINFP